MFPYPSGKLHPGHLRNYTIGDIYARFKKANKFDILHPMGFDAFGLPAENAAIINKTSPSVWTLNNIQTMKKEMIEMNFLYDWSKEINTSSVQYYKHEQRLFLDMFKNNLIYQKESYVNWDPVDQTVLANEQVVNGKGWRSGAEVEKKILKQWFVNITKYADELLNGLVDLTEWPEKVKNQQKEWIGKSHGTEIIFYIANSKEKLKIFTTRPETIFGASFIGLSTEHPLIESLKSIDSNINQFCQKLVHMSKTDLAKEKFGIFTGLYAKHPFLEKNIPIWICSFVLNEYGHGAVLGCPAHDKRDFEFAEKYNIDIIQILIQDNFLRNENFADDLMVQESSTVPIETQSNPFQPDINIPNILPNELNQNVLPYVTEEGIMVNSLFLNGMTTKEARQEIVQRLTKNGIGKNITTYKLRDWGISRQRYWGCPIPIIHCKKCGPVCNEDLPVKLPENINLNKKNLSLNQLTEWKKTTCPQCNNAAEKETDTLDTFFESSWYFLRFCDPHSTTPINKKMVEKWMPVDHYIGGIEHAVMHLLYARLFTKVLRDLNYIPKSISEPFKKLTTQGMLLHATFQKEKDLSYVYPNEVYKKDEKYFHKKTHESIIKGEVVKMSKSKKNTIDLKEIIDKVGVDAIKLFIISDTNPENNMEWSEQSLNGAKRFIEKLIETKKKITNVPPAFTLEQKAHITIKKVSEAIKITKLNNAVSFVRELFNDFIKENKRPESIFKIIVQLLYPFIPETTKMLYEDCDIWPKYKEEMTLLQIAVIAIQINGKLRSTMKIDITLSKEEVYKKALEIDVVKKYINGKNIKNIIYVPKKILNIVLC